MSTVNLVPSGTVNTYGQVGLSGAATVHQAVATGGVTSYVIFTAADTGTPAYFTVDLSTFTLPPGGVIVSIRNVVNASGTGAQFFALRDSSSARTYLGPVVASWVNYGSFDSDNAGVAPSTQDDIDGYRLWVYGIPSLASPNVIYVDQVYATLTYIGLPGISFVSQPSGAKTASAQTATWTFTKDAASPAGQSKFQLRVFNAAQYGIGGFDPATSPATYDTGVVASATSSHAIPAHVMRPGTYRCYVRGATTNSGLDQWSPYAFSSFSITLKSLNTWDGAAFTLKPVKIWNGTSFVEAVGVKIWNGTAWVNATNG